MCSTAPDADGVITAHLVRTTLFKKELFATISSFFLFVVILKLRSAVLADNTERLIRDVSSSTGNRKHISNLMSFLEKLQRSADDNDGTLGRSIVRLQHVHSAVQATIQWLALGSDLTSRLQHAKCRDRRHSESLCIADDTEAHVQMGESFRK